MTTIADAPTADRRLARLEIDHLTKYYGATTALDDVHFVAYGGEVHGLLGANGAGKSTLIEVIAGTVQATRGTIRIDDEPVEIADPRAAEQLGIGVIHQALSIIPSLTITENFLLKHSGEQLGTVLRPDRRRAKALAVEALDRLGVRLSPDELCERLSFSERQLVEIAIAISSDIKILVMDEPTSGLSEAEQERLFTVVDGLTDTGVAVIYVSHRMDEVFRLSNRVTVLREGRNVAEFDRDSIERSTVIEHILGREFDEAIHREPPTAHEKTRPLTVLAVRDLTTDRVDGISLTVQAGAIVGVYGVVGSGCSELLEAIFGARPGTGSVVFGDEQAVRRNPCRSRHRGVALVPPDHRTRGVVSGQTIAQNLLLGRGRWRNGWAHRFTRTTRDELTEMAASFKLKYHDLDQDIDALSGGNQQKVVFARWLLDRPGLLLLDDPTQGIDVGAKADIYDELRTLRGNGVGIVLHTSELTELVNIADRALVVRDGRVVGSLVGGEIDRHVVLAMATDA